MLKAFLKAMRPKQWIKNGLIFAAIVFDRQITNPDALFRTVAGAVLFTLVASAVYLVNDLSDIESDRNHSSKRHRPIASGALPVPAARVGAVLLLAVSLPLAYLLSPGFFLLTAGYFILNISYSLWLKHITILDVLFLASFYVIRVVAGVTLISVERFSPWLYIATTFVALLMGIGKRRAELLKTGAQEGSTRKVLDSYTMAYLDNLLLIVLTITIITYSLYTFSAPNLPENHITMLTIPFVIYGVFRYLYLVQVEERGEAPEEIVLSDRPFQINLLLWGASILLIFYLY